MDEPRPADEFGERGTAVLLVAWIAMACQCLTVLTKVWSRYRKLQSFFVLENAFAILAMISAILQTVAVQQQVHGGLGRHLRDLSAEDRSRFEKGGYAASMLYVTAMGFGKMSAPLLLMQIVPLPRVQRELRLVMISISAWTAIFLLAVAFECGAPNSWALLSQHCFDKTAFWAVYGASNIGLDSALIVIPISIFRKLNITRVKRIQLLCYFVLRIVLIPLAILRVVYLANANRSDDLTYTLYQAAVVTEVEIHSSIIMTCIPYLKPLWDSLQVGLMTNDLAHAPLPPWSPVRDKFSLSALTKSAGRSSERRPASPTESAKRLAADAEARNPSNGSFGSDGTFHSTNPEQLRDDEIRVTKTIETRLES